MSRRHSRFFILAAIVYLLALAAVPAAAVDRTGTEWEFWEIRRFDDTFDLASALANTAEIRISDPHDVVTASLFASEAGGFSWEEYPLIRQGTSDWWSVPPPVSQIAPSTEIWYYFEARDGLGIPSTYPLAAPDEYYEFSILPIHGSLEEPSILLVDKIGEGPIHGEFGELWYPQADVAYKEALDCLGFEYDVYDVPSPGSALDEKSWGPDSTEMDYYDTQIWFGPNNLSYFFRARDSVTLPQWLGEATKHNARNLLVATGNLWSILDELLGYEFVHPWVTPPYDWTQISVRDVSGGADFMTFDDGECLLHLMCENTQPLAPNTFDVIQPHPSVAGTEVAIEAVRPDLTTATVGVARADPDVELKTIRLGFGFEGMMGEVLIPPSHYDSGLPDRIDLMGNIMEFFGKEPTGTGAGGVHVARGGLGLPHPNPFNPQVTLQYRIECGGRAAVRIYNVRGQLVRTLLDEHVVGGETGSLVWDGRDEGGHSCGSGVYLCRLEASRQKSERKLVLVK